MYIMVFYGKIRDIIAELAKLNGITLGEYARLMEKRSSYEPIWD